LHFYSREVVKGLFYDGTSIVRAYINHNVTYLGLRSLRRNLNQLI